MDAKRLRSAVWSSETLLQGAKALSKQPDGLLAKTENEDADLEYEFQVPCLIQHYSLKHPSLYFP